MPVLDVAILAVIAVAIAASLIDRQTNKRKKFGDYQGWHQRRWQKCMANNRLAEKAEERRRKIREGWE